MRIFFNFAKTEALSHVVLISIIALQSGLEVYFVTSASSLVSNEQRTISSILIVAAVTVANFLLSVLYIRLCASLSGSLGDYIQCRLLAGDRPQGRYLFIKEIERVTSNIYLPLLNIFGRSIVMTALFIFLVFRYATESVMVGSYFIFAIIILMWSYKRLLRSFGAKYSQAFMRYEENISFLLSHWDFLHSFHKLSPIRRALSDYGSAFWRYGSAIAAIGLLPKYGIELALLLLGLLYLWSGIHLSPEVLALFGLVGLKIIVNLQAAVAQTFSLRANAYALHQLQQAFHNGSQSSHLMCDPTLQRKLTVRGLEDSQADYTIDPIELNQYAGCINFLADDCIKIKAGNLIVIQGPSGAGKSTLLVSMYHSLQLKYHQNKIGFVTQGVTPPNLSLVDIKQILGIDLNVKSQVLAYRALNLDPSKIISGGRPSGGEWQRIIDCEVFRTSYDIYLMDEPSTGLDKNSSKLLVKEIKLKAKMTGSTFLVVSHDREFIDAADYVIFVEG